VNISYYRGDRAFYSCDGDYIQMPSSRPLKTQRASMRRSHLRPTPNDDYGLDGELEYTSDGLLKGERNEMPSGKDSHSEINLRISGS
jgi:hypothetical protein